MLDFFVYINVDLPLNAQNFIALFDQNIFDMTPNPLEVDEEEYECDMHPKLKENGLKCMAMNNIG